MSRHVSGSLLPSSSPESLAALTTRRGELQVFAIKELDDHALFYTNAAGRSLIATHGNAFSLRLLAKYMAAGEANKAIQQAEYIAACGGATRALDHINAMVALS